MKEGWKEDKEKKKDISGEGKRKGKRINPDLLGVKFPWYFQETG